MKRLLWKINKIKSIAYYMYIRCRNVMIDIFVAKDGRVALLDTSIGSKNTGDQIINFYIQNILSEVVGGKKIVHIPTHTIPNREQMQLLMNSKMRVLCGTNILSPDIECGTSWKMNPSLRGYNNIIAMGVGWGWYCDYISEETARIYKCMFAKKGLHSARDSYTVEKMRSMGISNVINTGCPTMWRLNKEFCRQIPCKKAKDVVATITDYSQDPDSDAYMLSVLLSKYQTVYIWPQGEEDGIYINQLKKQLHNTKKIIVLSPGLETYKKLLERNQDIDYVGTRLHGGILALNYKKRTMIIGVDNRALEMKKDFNLPVIDRNEIKEMLMDSIDNERKIEIDLPLENIKKWLGQFS